MGQKFQRICYIYWLKLLMKLLKKDKEILRKWLNKCKIKLMNGCRLIGMLIFIGVRLNLIGRYLMMNG